MKATNLEFPVQQRPVAGVAEQVVDGIDWLCVPLPFALDHVNCWALRDDDGLFVVDTGVSNQPTEQLWSDYWRRTSLVPKRLLVTHYHPDHIGLAGWIEQETGCEVLATEIEWTLAKGAINAKSESFSVEQDEWYLQHGLDEDRRTAMRMAGNTYRPFVSPLPEKPTFVAAPDQLTIDGQVWQVITVAGHAPDMICLYDSHRNVLIGADHWLPEISPNVSLNFYGTDPNPLASFLDALNAFDDLPETVLVLPSHGRPFRGIFERKKQLILHHQKRFEDILTACKTPKTAAEILPVLFRRKLDFQQLMFAMGESIAHLEYLHLSGAMSSATADGVKRYQRN